MLVKVTAHEGHLVIDPQNPLEVHEDWTPVGESRFGSVFCHTKKHLQISQEALDLLDTIERGRDAIGDVDWFPTAEDGHAFSWFGPFYRIVKVDDCVAARNMQIYPEECTLIPNEVPPEALAAIEEGKAVWKAPFVWEDEPYPVGN